MEFLSSLLETLLSGVVTLIGVIVDWVMTPYINTLISLFPSMDDVFSNIVAFFEYATTFVTCVYRWFLFTRPMFVLLFGYFVAKFSIWVLANTYRVGVRFYNYFKP